jgi:hypothetical protein
MGKSGAHRSRAAVELVTSGIAAFALLVFTALPAGAAAPSVQPSVQPSAQRVNTEMSANPVVALPRPGGMTTGAPPVAPGPGGPPTGPSQ